MSGQRYGKALPPFLPMPTIPQDDLSSIFSNSRAGTPSTIRPVRPQSSASSRSQDNFFDAPEMVIEPPTPDPEQASLISEESQESYETASTVVDPRAANSRTSQLNKFPYARQPTLQRPPALPTIQSGRPLNTAQRPLSATMAFATAPEGDPFSNRSASTSAAPTTPSRPTSAYTPFSAAAQQAPSGSSSPSFLRARGASLPPTIAVTPPRPTSATFSSSPLDHFRHDTEAYASGRASGAYWTTPQSRSPTPGRRELNDDDYLVNGGKASPFMNQSPTPARTAPPLNTSTGYRASSHYAAGTEPVTEEAEVEDGLESEGYSEDEKETFEDEKWEHVEENPYLDKDGKPAPVIGPPQGWRPSTVVFPQFSEVPAIQPDEAEESTRHFGPAPAGRIHRRNKALKRVPLTNGNLIVELNVPPKLVLPWKGEPEMQTTKYSAVTGDPNDFERNGFVLRQNEYGRSTELFICVTMYNEDEVLFCRTIYGVMQNIAHLCTRKNSRTWGQDAWKKVVICIVADGRKKVHPRVLDCLTLLGVYQPGGHMKSSVDGKEVTAHVFEYTTSFSLRADAGSGAVQFCYPDKGIVPCQILFCMKEKNQKKINSHRWFFNAFAPMLQPNVCVLVDVGTMPGKTSIYHLWKAFDVNSNIGGACGEIAAYKGKYWRFLINPLVASQHFEYKISNILDKTTESMFGYISVLPGAFSAYRYIALQNNKNGVGPLASYFKGEVLHGRDTDIFQSNMYLAEDRILCFELVAKANSAWVLKYVNRAIAHTDVPDTLAEFISQRRRWLNGSFFAMTYAIAHTGQILRSGHSFGRKCTLMIETLYNCINLVFSWFAIGNFYLFFVILTSSLENPSFGIPPWIKFFNFIVQYLLGSLIIASFIFSMGNKPAASKWKYKITAILFALLMSYLLVAGLICLYQSARVGGGPFRVLVFGAVISYGVYFVSSFLALDPWHIIISFLPYLLLAPTYTNILNVYAFSNLDDISWGTKGDTTVSNDLGSAVRGSDAKVAVEVPAEPADADSVYSDAINALRAQQFASKQPKPAKTPAEKEQAAKDYYASVRTNVLLSWAISNGLLLVFILGGGVQSSPFEQEAQMSRTKAYLIFVLVFVSLQNIIRFLGSTLYLTVRLFTGT